MTTWPQDLVVERQESVDRRYESAEAGLQTESRLSDAAARRPLKRRISAGSVLPCSGRSGRPNPPDVRSATRLAAAVARVRQKARLKESPSELDLRRRFEQPLIDALGEEEWGREQAAGAKLTLEEAIELARTLAMRPEATPQSA